MPPRSRPHMGQGPKRKLNRTMRWSASGSGLTKDLPQRVRQRNVQRPATGHGRTGARNRKNQSSSSSTTRLVNPHLQMTKHSLLPMSPAAPAKVRSDSDMACVANRTCQQRRSTFAAAAPARQTIPRWLRRGVHRSLPSANPSLAYASISWLAYW
jgi:hypothetical protein